MNIRTLYAGLRGWFGEYILVKFRTICVDEDTAIRKEAMMELAKRSLVSTETEIAE